MSIEDKVKQRISEIEEFLTNFEPRTDSSLIYLNDVMDLCKDPYFFSIIDGEYYQEIGLLVLPELRALLAPEIISLSSNAIGGEPDVP